MASLDSEAFAECKNRLLKIKQTGQPELVVYVSLEFIACSTPLRTIRTVYTELLHLLFWGNPLRSIRKNQEGFSGFFLPYIEYFIACLDRPAPVAFAATLEELVTCLLNLSVELMAELGFSEVESLLIPSIRRLERCTTLLPSPQKEGTVEMSSPFFLCKYFFSYICRYFYFSYISVCNI